MDNKSIKNMVVLKNVPSNIVEEAIVILKTNKIAKKLEYIERKANVKKGNKEKRDDYIIKEAENVVESYIEKIEGSEMNNIKFKINKNYKALRNYSIVISILFLLMLLINVFK